VKLDENEPEALNFVLGHLYAPSKISSFTLCPSARYSESAQSHINIAMTADQLGVLDLAQQVAGGLKRAILFKEWESGYYADMMVKIVIPAIFGKHICAALETLKETIILSVGNAFKQRKGPLDEINVLLCQHPEMNKLLLDKYLK
jgi:hypothetical protein